MNMYRSESLVTRLLSCVFRVNREWMRLLSATLLFANAAHAQTQTWSLATDYPKSLVNPNGAWSYGYWDAGLTTFTLYNTLVTVPAGEARNNTICQNGDLDSWGNVGKDISSETFTRNDWPHGMHYVAGEVNVMSATVDTVNRIAAAGFAAPTAGDYTVTVTFKNNIEDGDGSRMLVISSLSGVQTIVTEATITGFGDLATAPESYYSYTNTFTLAAGDAIYFANAANSLATDPRWHQVGVDAQIHAASSMPPVLLGVSQSHGSLTLTWNSVTGRSYQLQSSSGSGTGGWSWNNVAGPIAATAGTVTTSASVGPELARFYRVVVIP